MKATGAFQMPIVRLSYMSMTESIASDCCYCCDASGLDRTFHVVNGGRIGSSPTRTYWNSGIVRAFGFADEFSGSLPPCQHFYTLKYTDGHGDSPYETISDASKVYYIPSKPGDRVLPTDLTQWTHVTAVCDHLTIKCPWVSGKSLSNAHIDATAAHALGGLAWDKPHTAYQYNS